MDLNELIKLEISNGYGVVMRSKTRNIRRATQDLDIDFIRLSLSNEAIDTFISKLNCLDGITLKR